MIDQFKKIIFSVILIIFTCIFSDKALAWSNDYYLYLDYDNSKITEIVNGDEFKSAMEKFNNLIENSSYDEYIIYLKKIDNVVTYYIDFLNYEQPDSIYSTNNTIDDIRVSSYFSYTDSSNNKLTSETQVFSTAISSIELYRYTYSNNVLSGPVKWGTTLSFFTKYNSTGVSFYNGYDYYEKSDNFSLLYYSSFPLITDVDYYGDEFLNIKIGNDFYSDLGYLPSYLDTYPDIEIPEGYDNYIDIPVSSLYDTDTSSWINYNRYFRSTKTDFSYRLKFELIEDENSSLPSLPIELFINENVYDVDSHISNINDGTYNSSNGFGGGSSVGSSGSGHSGGSGRHDDDYDYSSCLISGYEQNSFLNAVSFYGFMSLSLNSCFPIGSNTPENFKTQYIRIYYDVEFFNSSDDVIENYYEEIGFDFGEDSKYAEILMPIISLVNTKLPILIQLKNIYNSFQYVDEVDEPPVFEIDASSIGLSKMSVIDFNFYHDYRDTVFSWIKLCLSTVVLIKSINAIRSYFGGGD